MRCRVRMPGFPPIAYGRGTRPAAVRGNDHSRARGRTPTIVVVAVVLVVGLLWWQGAFDGSFGGD